MDRSTAERAALWGAVAVLVAVAVSFVPALGLALGDDHYGRILGRLVLHADNVLTFGLVDADWGASWVPYYSSPYAHHPPLPMAVQTLVAWLQGGATALGARLVGTLSGLVAVGVVGTYARRAGGSWLAAGLAATGLAVSGFFWTFGRLGLGLVPALLFVLVRELGKDRPGARWDVVVGLAAVLAALTSWEDAMVVGLICLLDLRRWPRRALLAGVGVAVGLVLDVVWIESAAGLGALFGHVQDRAGSADYSLWDWVLRQGGFYLRFENVGTFVVTAVALGIGLADRRFRTPLLALVVTLATFLVAFHQNAWVHEYWNWKSAYVLALGLGAVGARVSERSPHWGRWVAVGALALGVAIPPWRLGGDLYATQFTETSKAGELAERTVYPADQGVAWTSGGIPGPRWLSWYSGLPARPIGAGDAPAPDDLVLVRRSADDGLDDVGTVDAEGGYSTIRADDLGG